MIVTCNSDDLLFQYIYCICTLNLSTKWSWVLSLIPVHFTLNKDDLHPLNFSEMSILFFSCLLFVVKYLVCCSSRQCHCAERRCMSLNLLSASAKLLGKNYHTELFDLIQTNYSTILHAGSSSHSLSNLTVWL